MKSTRVSLCIAAAAAVLGSATLLAEAPAPITLAVDASEAPRRIFHVRETFPARTGAVTLVYPKWIPGEHGPFGPITDLVGLQFSADGRALPWRRDPKEMWRFTVDVPAGAASLEARFDYLAPLTSETMATAHLAGINWWILLLYPQEPGSNDLRFEASLRLPAGWKFGTALPVARTQGDTTTFEPVSLVTLIDSPVLAGRYFRSVDLTPGQSPGHWLDIAGDTAASVEIGAEDIAHYKRLVAEAGALFGARHYRNYHFLLALSDHIPLTALEHHESSDNRAGERALQDESARRVMGNLLAHEYVHSWNGKYRRPEGLVSGLSADYQQPVDSSLLWIYEGLTEYLGDVLAARSGIWTPELHRENIALYAAQMDNQAGRRWRPLGDTAEAAQLLYGSRAEGADWRRGVDFYREGELIWLEADVLIRQKTGGRKSLDDFVRAFHGAPGGPPSVKPYRREDVIAALNAVLPYDWDAFFRVRVDEVAAKAPLGGVENGGWKLVYTDVEPELTRASEEETKLYDFWYSLGVMIQGDASGGAEDGIIKDVVPGLPAAAAGIAPGMRLVAVNGRRYSEKGLRDALKAARDGRDPLELLIENVDVFQTVAVDAHGGERQPHLERAAGAADVLSAIGKPLTPAGAKP